MNLIYGYTSYKKPSKDEYLSVCKAPLGMESGEIASEFISCTPSSTVYGECTGTCGNIRYKSENKASFWCLSKADIVDGFFKVSFLSITVVTGFAVETMCVGCGIKKILLQYGFGDDSLFDYAVGTDHLTVVDTPKDRNLVWLNNSIVAKEVIINVMEFDSNVKPLFRARFEFYGCSYEHAAIPVGMQSGKISDKQIVLHEYEPIQVNYHNPQAARLNTVMFDGWTANFYASYGNTINFRQVWLSVDFGKRLKVLSVNVQQHQPANSMQNLPYFLYYGDSFMVTRPYTGIEGQDYATTTIPLAKLITPVSTNNQNKDGKYNFLYPLIAQYVAFYPTISVLYPYIKLEFYGTPYETPTYQWKFISHSLEDEVSFQKFTVPNEVTINEEGLFVNSVLSSQIKSLPLDLNDCLLNPENCNSGLTVSFQAKINEIPKGHLITHTISATDCPPQNFQSPFALFIPVVKQPRGTTVLSSTHIKLLNVVGVASTFKVVAEAHVNKEELFVTSCMYKTSADIPIFIDTVDVNCNTEECLINGLQLLLSQTFSQPAWSYGLSLSLIFKPSLTPVDYVIPPNSQWQFDLYVNYAWSSYSYGFIDSLNATLFSQKGTACVDTKFSASSVAFSNKDAWRDCDGNNNYLQIDLASVKIISMLKVAGSPSGFVETFSMEYTEKGTNWNTVLKNDGSDNPFVFTKTNVKSENLLLPTLIVAQKLRVYPKSHRGSYPDMKFDVIVKGLEPTYHIEGNKRLDFFILTDENVWFEILLNHHAYKFNYLGGNKVQYTNLQYGIQYDKNFKAVDGDVACLDRYRHVVSVPLGIWVPYSGVDCVDFVFTDTYMYCVEYNTYHIKRVNRVFRNMSTIEDTGTKFKQIDITANGDILYGIKQISSDIWKLQLNPVGSWEKVSDKICQKLKVSKDNTVWCLSDEALYEWLPYMKGWSLVISNCAYFDVSSSYVLCTKNKITMIQDRMPNKPIWVAGNVDGLEQIFLSEIKTAIFGFDKNCVKYNDINSNWRSAYCGKSCKNVWEMSAGQFRGCVKDNGFTDSENSNLVFVRKSVDVVNFDVDGDSIIFISPTDRYVKSSRRFCCPNTAIIRDTSGDAKEVQYSATTDTVYILKTNGDIVSDKDSNFRLKGSCDSFKLTPTANFLCLRNGNIFISKTINGRESWFPALLGKHCDSMDGNDEFVLCWVIGGGLYKAMLSGNSDMMPEFPILSSGLQRYKQTSQGKGFQIALSPLYSALTVSLQTEDQFVEGLFPVNVSNGLDSWNTYMFSWSTESKRLSLFVNNTIVGQQLVTGNTLLAAIKKSNFLNIGGFYGHLLSYSQNFMLRELKIWKHNLTSDVIDSFNVEKDTIPFSDPITDRAAGYQVKRSCSRSSPSTGPCFDLDLSQSNVERKTYFYGPTKEIKATASLNCRLKGGDLVSIHSEEEMLMIYNLSSMPNSQHVYIGFENNWDDGSQMNYKIFRTGTVHHTHICAFFISNQGEVVQLEWIKSSCDTARLYVCQSQGYMVSKSFTPVEFHFWNDTSCGITPYVSGEKTILAAYQKLSRNYTVILFDLKLLPRDLAILKAQLVYAASGEQGALVAVTIGVLNTNYTSCFNDKTFYESLDYASLVPWRIYKHSDGDSVISPDISNIIQFFLNKNKNSAGIIPLVLSWTVDGATSNIRNFNSMSLDIFYNHRDTGDNFLLFPSSYLNPKFPPGKYSTITFSEKHQSFSFWYHMKGFHVGTLYVWLIDSRNITRPYPAFVVQGNQGLNWKRAMIHIENGIVPWKITFLAYKRNENVGDIAIDSIEASPLYYNDTSQHEYRMEGSHNYLERLKTVGLPQPLILFTFSNVLNSASSFATFNKTLVGPSFKTIWTEDKFSFPDHAVQVFRNAGNQILSVADIQDVVEVVTTEFTILFHVKITYWTHPVVVIQFGESGDEVLRVVIDNDKLRIRHGSTDVYESSWRFTENTWAYIGITYSNKLNVYFNNAIDRISGDYNTTFPSSLHFFGDPSKIESDESFEGLFSCFQLYNKSITPSQIEALEFCPNRIDSVICPKKCHNGGNCIPLKAECHCPEKLGRYYLSNCDYSLSNYYATSIYHRNFDLEDYANETHEITNSPLNQAQCSKNVFTIITSNPGSCFADLSGCPKGFFLSFWFYVEEYRNIGYTDIFKFGNLIIAANFTFQAENPSLIVGTITWQSDKKACTGQLHIPIEAWVYFNVWVTLTKMKWYVNSEEMYGDATCKDSSDVVVNGDVSFAYGNALKICIDEVVAFNYTLSIWKHRALLYQTIAKVVKDPYFQMKISTTNGGATQAGLKSMLEEHIRSLSSLKGADFNADNGIFASNSTYAELDLRFLIQSRLSDGVETELSSTYIKTDGGFNYTITRGEETDLLFKLQPIKSSENYFASFKFLVIAKSIYWTDELLDRDSEEFFGVNKTLINMMKSYIDVTYPKLKLYESYEFGSLQLMKSKIGTVKGFMNVILKVFFRYDYGAVAGTDAYLYNGLDYEIQMTNSTRIPAFPVTYNVSVFNESAIHINITNPEIINKSFHKGYVVKASIFFPANGAHFGDETKVFYTGTNLILYAVTTFRRYTFTVYSFSHEGWSPAGVETEIITPSTRNLVPPIIESVGDVDSTSISLSWKKYDLHHYNSLNMLAYTILYKKTSDPDVANISTYNMINVSSVQQSYTLTELDVFTEYQIYLGTWNDIGLGALDGRIQRSGPGVPEIAPNITSIELVENTMVRLNWSALPEDIDLYNAYELSGYEIEIVPLVPLLVSSECQYFIFTLNDISITSLEHTTHCEPMKIFNVTIAAVNLKGRGVKNEYCYTLGRTTPGKITVLNVTFGDAMENDTTSENITIGLIPLAEENTVVTYYQIHFRIMNWEDDWKVFNVSINHTMEDVELWDSQKEGFFQCPRLQLNGSTSLVKASSKIVQHHLFPLIYYTNYSMIGKACSEEGCSEFNMSILFRTIGHIPFCPSENITLFNTSSTSMNVSFAEITHFCLAGELLFYGVIVIESEVYEKMMLNSSSIEEVKKLSHFNKTLGTEIEFFGLREYWNYTVLVYAENNYGVGNVSVPVHAMTDEDVPHGPPLNCGIVHYNSTTFSLCIGKPNRYLINGNIKYNISVKNGYGDHVERIINVTGDETWTMFANMTKFMYHNITVTAFTRIGPGPSVMLYNRTLEDIPTLPPANFSMIDITNDSLKLKWSDVPPRSLHGVLVDFNISGQGFLENGTVQTLNFYVKDYEYTFLHLFPATLYKFRIRACTRKGCGEVGNVEGRTLEMVPSGVVNDISATNFTSNSFNISWSNVYAMERRGVIIYKNISLTNILHPEWQKMEDEVTLFYLSNTTHVLANNLDNHTSYKVNIAAYTEIGAGPTTEEIVYTTNETVPSAAPQNVTGVDTSSNSLNVSWLPIHPSDHEGVLLGYYIKFDVEESFTDTRGNKLHGHLLCVGKEKTSCIIAGLSLHTPYVIQVAGYTSIGLGPLSAKINATTGEFTDGNWTIWTNWGACSKSCGLGYETRYRWCTNPEPDSGGDYCPGVNQTFKTCNNFTCPGFYLSREGESCADSCQSLGKDFDCAFFMDLGNSSARFLDAIDVRDYTRSVDVACNVTKSRSVYKRAIDPVYDVKNKRCNGFVGVPKSISCSAKPDSSQRRLCRCIDEESAQYSEWANWGLCTKSCGSGKYQRYRECLSNTGCTGSNVDFQDCNINPCPIDGEWGDWTLFSNCSKPCGFGKRVRTRSCDSPKAEYGGKECDADGGIEELEGCNPYPCPQHGQWGPWQSVSECKHSCSLNGKKVQMRYCTHPVPLFGGRNCVGDNNRTFPCEKNLPCTRAKYFFDVRFIDEVWQFPMYVLSNEMSVNLSRRIEKEIRYFYANMTMYDLEKEIRINFHSMSKGSVIVQFSIEYQAVPHVEALVLQHTIENGFLNAMPVGLKQVSVSTLPNSPPPQVTAQSDTPFTINVSWDAVNASMINGNFYMYQVFYKKVQDNTWDNFGTANESYQLVDLDPGTEYVIRVLAATHSGNGVASSQIIIRTIEGKPYIKPPSCSYLILDAKTVYFSWSEIPSVQVPGILRGYEIKYRKYFDKNNTHYSIADETMSQKTVATFRPYTWYWVEVAGFTSAGTGPFELFVFQTPPGAPEIAPPNATAHERESTTEMLVTWDFMSKENENGYLAGYRLYYRRVQVSGVDLPSGEPFVDVILDRFTKRYLMTGLESYTQYEITLYAFSVYGDGPKVVLLGDTCKCPKYIFNNWFESKPYIEQIGSTSDLVKGLYPDILTMVVDAICTGCRSHHSTMYYNKTRDGRSSKKSNVANVKKYLDDNVHFSFPIFGRFTLTRFAGEHPFVGIISSQGSALIVYQPEYKTVGFVNIFKAVFTAWPVVLIAVLLAMMSGWILWFLEQSADSPDLTQDRSIYGAYEAFWMSFITMTTLGYGDYVPAANVSKAFMIVWILVGLAIVSIFGGTVSTGMSVSSLDKEYKLYGTKVAAINNSFEQRMSILRNAIVDSQSNYTTITQVMDAVSNGNVELGIVDAFATKGYNAALKERNLKIYKILDLQSGYGVVLSGEFKRLEDDMRSYVSSNQARISLFVEKKIGILQPEVLEVEELLLTPEESTSAVLYLIIMYLVMACIGCFIWFFFISRRPFKKIQPQDDMEILHDDLVNVQDIFKEFKTSFKELVNSYDAKHSSERVQLNDLKRNYSIHVKRGNVPQLVEYNGRRRRRRLYQITSL
ncbi:uncharacterized protein LOC130614680 isoform X2 [Hydractinia symbiolongicarpus]|nr:uncharacterized protein LOC130614680 isoform X2 [Hydractinia symbiolongicarpus]